MSIHHQATRNSEPSLWEQAVTLWNDLVLGFGHPIDLMRWGWMRALEHRTLLHWLRDLEDLVRRAIRKDAIALDMPAPNPRATQRDRRQTRPASPEDMPRFRRSYSDDPETWKVSFRMSKPVPRPGHHGPRARIPSEKRRCRPLAYRIEALRRAINHREDYVLRYARRLARIEQATCRAADPHHPSGSLPDNPPEHDAGAPEATPRNAKHVEPG